ncbi:hypothetical protein [Aneurinibacillus uraniidurans]|uniref:hypothetical protein n=1 Tax=Aneurinibacillus uraniidurans TaxID=2966586 RepID=UPI0023493263|nr:hypothetical protein [Aneurinibacillus sp. B1]WCN39178.1 hypothetical protein PO771_07230 [Aneurinibacillus sp. B1]
MPTAGDTFITTLKRAHLEWGAHRYTSSRGTVYGEGYLQIPRREARHIGIYNSNHPYARYTFNCSSVDGFLQNVTLKASGCSRAGDAYAKQFQGSGNLKLLGDWFNYVGAQIGDKVRISWISPTDIEIEKI